MAAAFLFNDEHDVLFLQKKPQSNFLSGFLVPIGGHVESNELNDPNMTCIREIEEETGLMGNSLSDLTLRYIVLRMKDNKEIRMQYVYFGNVKPGSKLVDGDEGKLSWVNSKEIINQNVTVTTKEIIKHYLEEAKLTDQVYVGSMKSLKGEPQMTWALLEDWEYPVTL